MIRFNSFIAIALLIAQAANDVTAQAPNSKLEEVVTIRETPGNVTISPDGRIFASLHPFGKSELSSVEIRRDGTVLAYPGDLWSKKPGQDGIGIHTIIGIRADESNTLWLLDAGGPNLVPRLISWDIAKNALKRVIHFPPPASKANSFFQDLAIDPAHQAVYIADMSRADLVGISTPAIVVVDLKTGLSRRRLEGHPSLNPEEISMTVEGSKVMTRLVDGSLQEPRIGLNPITIDSRNEWVYFGAMHGTSLYRVRTIDLLDTALTEELLGKRVQRYGPKPLSDGISIDTANNVYITDVEANAIGVVTPEGKYERIIIDDRNLLWPDGFSSGADGYMYVVVNQLHRHPALSGGQNSSKPPFKILRFKPLAPIKVGR